MAAVGRKGGQIGGKRRLKTVTKAERPRSPPRPPKPAGSAPNSANLPQVSGIGLGFLITLKVPGAVAVAADH